MKSYQKSLESKGLNEYSLDDTLVYSFITMYGFSDLWIKDVKMLSEHLKRSEHSVQKQMCNIRYLMGCSTRVLSDYSDRQKEVFDFIKGQNEYEVRRMVKGIIKHDEKMREMILEKKGYRIDYMKFLQEREVKVI